MRLLLDSHALIWTVNEPAKLGSAARVAIADPTNEIFISAGTAWESSIKSGLGKLRLSPDFATWINTALADLKADLLPITVENAAFQASLPIYHRDPFDRMFIAQAIVEKMAIVSAELLFDQYGCQRIW